MSILRTIGIDISRDWLDVFAAPEGRVSRFSNDPTGLRKLIAWIGSEVDRIACEPTGPYHRDFEDALLALVPAVSKARVLVLASGNVWLGEGANVLLFGLPDLITYCTTLL